MTPTPAEIRNEIESALQDDYRKHDYNGPVMPIPVRVRALVNEAISRACDAAERIDQ